ESLERADVLNHIEWARVAARVLQMKVTAAGDDRPANRPQYVVVRKPICEFIDVDRLVVIPSRLDVRVREIRVTIERFSVVLVDDVDRITREQDFEISHETAVGHQARRAG